MTIHHKNLQKLAIEMYKVKHNLSLPLINNLFKTNASGHNLRNNRYWEVQRALTITYGIETIENNHRGPQTWDMLPNKIKESTNLETFKNGIKNWKPVGCKCRLCKTFIPNLGFL